MSSKDPFGVITELISSYKEFPTTQGNKTCTLRMSTLPLPGKQVTWTEAAEAQAYPKSVEISSILCAGTFSSRRP